MDDGYRTDKGIGVGVGVDTVRSAYGMEDGPDTSRDGSVLVYDGLGVAVLLDAAGPLAGHVSEIYVFVPGQYKTIFQQMPSRPGSKLTGQPR